MREDNNGATPESQHYLAAAADAEAQANRAVELAGSPTGIPPTGALSLLRSDPKTQGPKLFREHCAACHSHSPGGGRSTDDLTQVIVAEKSSASNLWQFGTRQWIRGMLDPEQVAGPHYFGNTAFKEGEMVGYVKETIGGQLSELKGEELATYQKQIDDVTFALAEEGKMLREMYPQERVTSGRDAIVNVFACIDCHKFRDEGALGGAPDLTGYASREWLTEFISNPAAERFYRDTNDRMPAFAPKPHDPANRLSPEDLEILVSWLRGEWYEANAQINPPAR